MTNPHIGTSLDEWLAETFTPEARNAIDATAQQRVSLWQRHAARMANDAAYRKYYEMEDRVTRRKVRRLARQRS